MTKEAALKAFFSGFGIRAYTSASVPKDVEFPYLTYTPAFDSWGGEPVSLTVNLWYYTTGESEPNAKARELATAIGLGGKVIPCDGGYIWLRRGSPWCQNLADEVDPAIKRRYINVTAEYLTFN